MLTVNDLIIFIVKEVSYSFNLVFSYVVLTTIVTVVTRKYVKKWFLALSGIPTTDTKIDEDNANI